MLKMPGAYKGGDSAAAAAVPPPASSSSPQLPPPSLSLYTATPEQQSSFLAHLTASSHVPPLPHGLLSNLSAANSAKPPPQQQQQQPRWFTTDPPVWPDHASSGTANAPGLDLSAAASQHHHQQQHLQHHQPAPPAPVVTHRQHQHQQHQQPAAAAPWIKDQQQQQQQQHSIFPPPPHNHHAFPPAPPSAQQRPMPVVPALPAHLQDGHAMAPAAPPTPFLGPFLSTFSGPSLSELQHLQQLASRMPAVKAGASTPAPPPPLPPSLPTDLVPINGFRHGAAGGSSPGGVSAGIDHPLFAHHASRFSNMQSQLKLRGSPGFPDPSGLLAPIAPGPLQTVPPPLLSDGFPPPFAPASTSITSAVIPTFLPPLVGGHVHHQQYNKQPPLHPNAPPHPSPATNALGNAALSNANPFSSSPLPGVLNVPVTSATPTTVSLSAGGPALVDPYFAAWAQQLPSEERGLCVIKLLLACAEAAASTNMTLTNQILEQLSLLSNLTGGPLQRVATYFMKGLASRVTKAAYPGIYKALNSTCLPALPDLLAARQVFFGVCPYLKFAFLAVNQAIMDVMQVHKMVHVVDLEAIDAVQWVALLQALAVRPGGPPHLRISGVSERADLLEKLGQQLSVEAGKLGVPFQFHAIVVKIENLTKDMLRLKPGEALAVSSVMRLHLLLSLDEDNPVTVPRSTTVAVVENQATSQSGGTGTGGRASSPFPSQKSVTLKEKVPAPKAAISCGSAQVDVGLNLFGGGGTNSSNSGTSFKAPGSEKTTGCFTAWAAKSENGTRSSADSGAVIKKEHDLFSSAAKRDGADQPEDSGHGSGFSLWSAGAPAGREKEVVSRMSPSHSHSGDGGRRRHNGPGRSELGKDSPKHFLSSFDRAGHHSSSPQRSGGHNTNLTMDRKGGMGEVDQHGGEVDRSRAGTGDTSGTDVSTLTEEGSPAPERLLHDEKRDLVQRLYNAKHALLEKVHGGAGGIDMNRRSEPNDCSYVRAGDLSLDMNKSSCCTGMEGAAGTGSRWLASGVGIDVNKASEESEEERRGEIDINRCFDKGQPRMRIDVNSVEDVGAQSVQDSRGHDVVGRNNNQLAFQLQPDRGVKRSSEQMMEESPWKLGSSSGGNNGKDGAAAAAAAASFVGFIGNSQRENDSRSAALRFHQERQLMAERGYPSVLAVGHLKQETPVVVSKAAECTQPPNRGLMSALTAVRPGPAAAASASPPAGKCSRILPDDDTSSLKLGGPGGAGFSLDYFARKAVKEEQVSDGSPAGRAVKEEYGQRAIGGASGKGGVVKEDYSPRVVAAAAPGSSSGSGPAKHGKALPAFARVLQMLKSLQPKVMVVVEQDSSHNSGSLPDRFLQALHYYSAMFDSLDSTLSPHSPERVILEKHLLGQEIHDIVACEGRDRLERHEKLEVWKRRMSVAGFAPLLFSQTTSVQAQRLLRNCFSEGYRMVEENGCLTLCWKNTPLFSASAWHSDFPL